MTYQFEVHSEVGKLRTVMVCGPSLSHQRPTPGNCHDLLFDDVIWAHKAQKDHYDFTLKMQKRGVELLEAFEDRKAAADSAQALIGKTFGATQQIRSAFAFSLQLHRGD